MLVRLRQTQLNYFRGKARDTEDEIYAYLVGTVGDKQVTVDYFVYPELAEQTPMAVSATLEAFQNVREDAEAKGKVIVGDLHSHPNWWPVKSSTDHKSQLKEGFRLCGVCAVMSRRTKIYFWIAESSLPCRIEYV